MSPQTPIKTVQKLFKSKKKKRRKNHKIGLPPGALVFTGDKKLDEVEINLITYDEVDFYEESIQLEQLGEHLKLKKKVLWIDIIGLHNIELLEKVGALFSIHKLTLEDILNVDQRPKMEAFEDYLFAAMKMIQCPTHIFHDDEVIVYHCI